MGERYYLVRTVARNLVGLCVKRQPRADRPLPQDTLSRWKVLIESRRWVVRHARDACRDRLERKRGGMIPNSVCRHLCWHLQRLASLKLQGHKAVKWRFA